MNFKQYQSLVVCVLFITSCDLQNRTQQEPLGVIGDPAEDPTKAPIHTPPARENTLPPTAGHGDAPNFWSKIENQGDSFSMMDYSAKNTLNDDTRVHELYKKEFPDFTKNYVLYRTVHGGSCWAYSASTLLAYQLIDSGTENFAEAIKTFESLGKSYDSEHFKKFVSSGKFEKFLDVFRYIHSKMNFKDALDLMNHKPVAAILDEGIRAFVAANIREKYKNNPGYPAVLPKQFETDPTKWGSIYGDVGFLAAKAKVGWPGMSVSNDGTLIEFSYPDMDEKIVKNHRTQKEFDERAGRGEEISMEEVNKAVNIAINDFFKADPARPKVLFFRSSPDYMDIAVLKTLADEINAQK